MRLKESLNLQTHSNQQDVQKMLELTICVTQGRSKIFSFDFNFQKLAGRDIFRTETSTIESFDKIVNH